MSHLIPPVTSPAAWKGPEIDWKKEGLHIFDSAELQEIDGALKHLKSLGNLDIPQITRETFPLDKVGKFIESLREKLLYGRGFAMLRGLPRDSYSADDMARIYFGLGCYLGDNMTQSYLGDYLGHVIDVSDVEPKSRAYRKGGAQSMHTDSCDVIGLMCMRTAKQGGESRLASSMAIYNEMLRTRPDLAEVLCKGFIHRRSEEDGKHATRYTSPEPIPLFTMVEGQPSCYFLGGYVKRAEEMGDIKLTKLDHEAIDEFERLARSPDFYLDMSFADGDIQFINNRITVHGRTDYEDYREMAKRRHLMRIWLSIPTWPKRPAQVFHQPEDHRLWSLNRRPYMEFPSIALKELEDRYQALAAAE